MQVGNESCDRENKHREIVKLLEAILAELKSQKNPAPLQYPSTSPTIAFRTMDPCAGCQTMKDMVAGKIFTETLRVSGALTERG